ncbi:MAG: spore coat protein U domain-containing protein [Ramlibacter sp.]|nr:spore coat protein U domain-containing protein [Ramlibacter sp.]
MKKLALVAALGLAAIGMSAQAATATGNFDVTINLTSACEIASSPTAAFSYTSFQSTAATFSSSFNIRCTNTLPITSITLDSTSVTDAATNLAYTLALSGVPASGTGASQSVSITGSMAANQAGTCATATCTNAASANKQRTLTITY